MIINVFKSLLFIICATVFVAFVVSIDASFSSNLILVGLFSISFLLKRFAPLALLTIGILSESISPYPLFSYFASVTVSFYTLKYISRGYLTEHTFFGVFLACIAATVSFEVSVLAFSNFFSFFSHGWTAILSMQYAFIAIKSILWTSVLTVLIFILAQKMSTKIRGTAIKRNIALYYE